TVIMVTHGTLAAGIAGRTVELRDGRLVNGASRRERCIPAITDESAELSWVVWRDAQSVTEWEAGQLTALGVSDDAGQSGLLAEAVRHARANGLAPGLSLRDPEPSRGCAGRNRGRNRRTSAFDDRARPGPHHAGHPAPAERLGRGGRALAARLREE